MREIVEEDSFKQSLADLGIKYKRFDEVMEGVTFALCERPELFPKVVGTHIRRIRIQECLGVPEADIWFTYNTETVRLLHIEALPQ